MYNDCLPARDVVTRHLTARCRYLCHFCGTFKRKNCDHIAVFIKNTEEINNVWYIILVCGGNILITYVQHILII